MPTLLLPPRRNNDTEALAHAATRKGWKVVPAPHWRLPSSLRLSPPVAVYGDPLFADLAAAALDLALLEPSVDWLPGLPQVLRQRDVTLTTLASARAVSEPWFIKPAEDKSFPADVYTDAAALLAVTPDLPDEVPVLVSELVIWEVEYRVFVHDEKAVTISSYFRNGELVYTQDTPNWSAPPDEQAEAMAFVTQVLQATRGTLPSGVVVDIGKIAGRGFAVVEANPAWASGLYGCDPAIVLDVVAASVQPRTTLIESDARFARPAVVVE